MPNFSMLIKGHNSRILNEHLKQVSENEQIQRQLILPRTRGRPKTVTEKECTCQRNMPCPLNGKCNVKEVIYEARVHVVNDNTTNYLGQALDFKKRYRNHMSSFNNRDCYQSCNLKDKIWAIQDERKDFTVEWRVKRQSAAYKPGGSMCCLCLDENLSIRQVYGDQNNLKIDK